MACRYPLGSVCIVNVGRPVGRSLLTVVRRGVPVADRCVSCTIPRSGWGLGIPLLARSFTDFSVSAELLGDRSQPTRLMVCQLLAAVSDYASGGAPEPKRLTPGGVIRHGADSSSPVPPPLTSSAGAVKPANNPEEVMFVPNKDTKYVSITIMLTQSVRMFALLEIKVVFAHNCYSYYGLCVHLIVLNC